MSYNNNIVQTLGVANESSYPHKMGITVAVDTLGMCTISFGTSFSIRIPEDDLDAFREVLGTASVMLMNQAYGERNREAAEEMAAEADDYSPEAEVAAYGDMIGRRQI